MTTTTTRSRRPRIGRGLLAAITTPVLAVLFALALPTGSALATPEMSGTELTETLPLDGFEEAPPGLDMPIELIPLPNPIEPIDPPDDPPLHLPEGIDPCDLIDCTDDVPPIQFPEGFDPCLIIDCDDDPPDTPDDPDTPEDPETPEGPDDLKPCEVDCGGGDDGGSEGGDSGGSDGGGSDTHGDIPVPTRIDTGFGAADDTNQELWVIGAVAAAVGAATLTYRAVRSRS